MTKPDHPSFEELTDLAYGLAAEPARIEEHVRGCPECRGTLDGLDAERGMLQGALSSTPIPPQLQGRIVARLRRRALRYLPLAAAAALLACMAGLLVLSREVGRLSAEVAALRERPDRGPRSAERILVIRSDMDPEIERRAVQVAWELAESPKDRVAIEAALREPYFESMARFHGMRAGRPPGPEFLLYNPLPGIEARLGPVLAPERMGRFRVLMTDWHRDRAEEIALDVVEAAARELHLDDAQRERLRDVVLRRVSESPFMVAFAPREVGAYGLKAALARDDGFIAEMRQALPEPQADRLRDILFSPAGER
jgi:hypothetical protein